MKSGQSLVEYLVLFAILVGLTLVFFRKVPDYFKGYVSKATEEITKQEAVNEDKQ